MTYVIIAKREWYGPKTTRSVVQSGNGRALQFATAKAAREHIEALDSERYYTAHNESSRPTYSIRKADALPAYLANYL